MSTISSDSEDEHSLDSISDNEIIETPAQKRLRLAKAYIQKLDDSKLDVLDTLNQDYSNLQGSRVEDTNYSQSNLDRILKFPKKLVIQSSTAACAISTPSSVLVYAVSKDASIVSWDLLNNVRKIIKGELKQTKKRKKRCFKKPNENIHSDQLLTVASSSDGLFLVRIYSFLS